MSLLPSWRRLTLAVALCLALSLLPSLFSSSIHSADAAVVAVDFGSEYIKVASSTRGSFHIVVDEQSKRKIPACVAFDQGERHFGNGGIALALRKPKETYLWAHRLLGHSMDSYWVQASKDQGFPYEFVNITSRNAIGYKHNKDVTYSTEEIIGMSFQHIAKITEADGEGAAVKDLVITVPPFWSQRERQALLDAAELAGFNVLSLINENSAALIQYGIDRTYKGGPNDTHTMMLYNMGSTSTKVDIARFTSYTLKEGRNKNRTVGQVEIIGRTFDETLGGHAFELLIADFVANEVNKAFAAKGDKTDIRTIPRAYAKIRSAAEKAKVVLSANQDTPIFLNSLHNDMDFKFQISRADFVAMADELIKRSVLPVERILEETKLDPKDLDAVVIIGGSVRIPAIQAALKTVLKREHLQQNLNGDESPVMGAVFRAANMSTTHHVRPFGLVDISLHPVGVRITNMEIDPNSGIPLVDENGKAHAEFAKRASLFKKHNRLGKRKTVQFGHTRDFQVTLHHEDSAVKTLPRSIGKPIISYNVTGLTAIMTSDKYKDLLPLQKDKKPRLALSFALDASGIAALVKAEATLEEMVKIAVPKKKAASNDTATNATTEEGEEGEKKDEKKEEEAAAEGEKKDAAAGEEVEYTEKKKTHTIPLTIIRTRTPLSVEPLSTSDRVASREVLQKLSRADEHKKEVAAAKNQLESYIYATRGEIADSKFEEVSTEEQREAVTSALSQAEEWLYDQGDDSSVIFKDRLGDLKNLADPIFTRYAEISGRFQALNTTQTMINFTRNQVTDYEKNRPWVKKEELEKLTKLVDEVETWITEKEAAQKKLALTADPAWTSQTLYDRLRPIAKLSQELMKVKKPYEKPKPKKAKNATNGTATNASESTNTTTGGGDATPNTIEVEEVSAPVDQEKSTEETQTQAETPKKDEL